jgi:hypothetical protein
VTAAGRVARVVLFVALVLLAATLVAANVWHRGPLGGMYRVVECACPGAG